MRVSLAAFTSDAVAPGGIPWVGLSRIMYRDTRHGRAVTIKTNEKSKRKRLGYSMRLAHKRTDRFGIIRRNCENHCTRTGPVRPEHAAFRNSLPRFRRIVIGLSAIRKL